MIRGELVNLRAVERTDVDALHGWLNDPTTMHGWGVGDATLSSDAVRRRIEGWIADEEMDGRPAGLVIETLDGEAVGLVVLSAYEREHRTVEISMLIGRPEDWGRGLGFDALGALLDVCFDQWDLHRVSLRCEAFNARAERLYRRLGFRHEGTFREATYLAGRRWDVLAFGLLASDREPAQGRDKAGTAP